MLQLPTLNKKKKNTHIDVNPIEAVRDLGGSVGKFGSDVADHFKDEFGQKGIDTAWKQILGRFEEQKDHAEKVLHEGEEMILSEEKKTVRRPDIAPGIDYHREMRYNSERSHTQDNREVQAKMDQILVELEKLIETSSDLEAHFEVFAVEQKPVEPGTYHLNFFDWMINIIQAARQQIEDSSAWLGALQSKKGKKSYWAMFKKHGTTFGMSNERMVATQSG